MLFDSISVLLCCVIIADVAVYNPFNKSSTSEIALFPVASPEHLFYNENQHFSYYRIYIPVREGFDRKNPILFRMRFYHQLSLRFGSLSMLSSMTPVPTATQSIGFSATRTGTLSSSARSWSSPFNSAPAGNDNAAVDDVSGQFRRCSFKNLLGGLHNDGN